MEEECQLSKRHLVLHFDLNKTILTIDPYDNIPNTNIFVCDIIARMAWGEVVFNQEEGENQDCSQKTDQDYRNATWVLKNNNLSQSPPEEGLISYREYLNKCFTYKSPTNDEEMDILTNTILKERNQMLIDFYQKEGIQFKLNYDNVLK